MIWSLEIFDTWNEWSCATTLIKTSFHKTTRLMIKKHKSGDCTILTKLLLQFKLSFNWINHFTPHFSSLALCSFCETQLIYYDIKIIQHFQSNWFYTQSIEQLLSLSPSSSTGIKLLNIEFYDNFIICLFLFYDGFYRSSGFFLWLCLPILFFSPRFSWWDVIFFLARLGTFFRNCFIGDFCVLFPVKSKTHHNTSEETQK